MKNQYFGDKRDLFKYDLMTEIAKGIPAITQVVFIPMLTPDDGTGQGQQVDYDIGSRNQKLLAFLKECRKEGRRDIREIERYFGEAGIRLHIYGADEQFQSDPEARKRYFATISEAVPSHALVFVDPDTGLEIGLKQRPTAQHLLCSEVRQLYDCMDGASVLMLFQYCRYVIRREKFLQEISEGLTQQTGDQFPLFVSDKKIGFFFLVKGAAIRNQLSKVLIEYRSLYPKLLSSTGEQ